MLSLRNLSTKHCLKLMLLAGDYVRSSVDPLAISLPVARGCILLERELDHQDFTETCSTPLEIRPDRRPVMFTTWRRIRSSRGSSLAATHQAPSSREKQPELVSAVSDLQSLSVMRGGSPSCDPKVEISGLYIPVL